MAIGAGENRPGGRVVAEDATAGRGAPRAARFAQAKFRPTTLPSTLVARPTLHDRLNAGARRRLTVVVGSAGAGKSVLLSRHDRRRAPVPGGPRRGADPVSLSPPRPLLLRAELRARDHAREQELQLRAAEWFEATGEIRRATRPERTAQPQPSRARRMPAEPLTAAETRILKLLPASTYPQIATTLYISCNTVKTHIRSIYQKLGVTSRLEAIERALDLRLL